MKVTPLFDNVLIEPLEAQSKTQSGIILPDNAQEKPQMGKIIALGRGKENKDGKLSAMVVKIGDVVLYEKWGGTEVKLEGKEYTLVSQEKILGIVAQK